MNGVGSRMDPWGTPVLTRYSCKGFTSWTTQGLLLLTKEDKSKYLTWNSIRLKFAKKTSIPNSVQRLGYIKCYSSSTSWIQHPTFNVWLKIFSIWHNLLSCTCTNHCLNNLVNFKFNALSDLKYSLSRNIKAEHEASNDENRPFEAHC